MAAKETGGLSAAFYHISYWESEQSTRLRRQMGLFTRSIRPPETPNGNDPAESAPGTVGPPTATPGDPHGVLVDGDSGDGFTLPPRIIPSPWSGWPADWNTPGWNGANGVATLADTAWMCVDLNANVLSTMPPYLVNAAPTLARDWLRNPDPNIYTSFEEFAKQLFWDYQLGEAFVLATAWYATGWPARFHVVPPWAVNVEMDEGRRRYSIGNLEVSSSDLLHIRYQSSVSDARGHGPLEVGNARVTAAHMLARYATTLAAGGGIPPSILTHPEELTPQQVADMKSQWMNARMSSIGEPAVLTGGITWEGVSVNPKDMALLELAQFNEARIAVLLGVPPFLVGLPSGGDSLTYSNVTSLFDYHWRAGLRPRAQHVMGALSNFLLPRGTKVELNRDEYVQPGPLERAQTAQILFNIVDPASGQRALTIDELRYSERLDDVIPDQPTAGVLQ